MDRFIVGTGRCGSTLLSHMLGHNRKVLSISEFWPVFDREAVFLEGQFTGEEVVELVSRSNLLNDLVVSRSPHLDAADTGHSMRKEVGEFAPRAYRLPALHIFLHGMSDDHEQLIAETTAHLRGQPRQSLAKHWRSLFEFLRVRLGKEVWLERSGASIEHVGAIAKWFPEAKFIHLHRDGPTNALGIRAFRHFVLYTSFYYDPPSEDELAAIFECEVGSSEDPIMRRLGPGLPSLSAFGDYWSWQVVHGQTALMALPAEQWTTISYEDMVASPHETLGRISEFFDLPPDEGWMDRAAAEIDTDVIPDRVSELARDELLKLQAACRPGMTILGRDKTNPYEKAIHSVRRVFASQVIEPATMASL